MIPYGRQSIDQSDIDAVVAVLKSDFLTQGPAVPAFEKAVCDYVGARHGVAVNSATSALHIACLALGVGPGDIVWTSPNTFVASANCARYCGADVDFVDIDSRTYNLCAEKLADKLVWAEKNGKLPKVVIPVHFAGQSCEMVAIHKLSQRYGFAIIEDASHAIGGTYQGKPIGNCQYSDITVFSFHPVKIITTGEGGMVTTNRAELHESLIRLRTHGITRDPELMTEPSHGPWYYQQLELGLNYRMTDIQAALGLSQLKHLDNWVARRHWVADRYDELLAHMPVSLPYRSSDSRSSFHLYSILVDNRQSVFDQMRYSGVGVNVHYIPIHLQPYYQSYLGTRRDLTSSESYYARAMSLPMFASITEQQISHTVESLRKALR